MITAHLNTLLDFDQPMHPSEATARRWLAYTLLGMIADTFDTVFIAISPPKRPHRSVLVSSFNMLPSGCLIEMQLFYPAI